MGTSKLLCHYVPELEAVHSVDKGPEGRLKAFYYATINGSGVFFSLRKWNSSGVNKLTPAMWCLNGLKRKDPHSPDGMETAWNEPDTGPMGETDTPPDTPTDSSDRSSPPDDLSRLVERVELESPRCVDAPTDIEDGRRRRS